MAQLYLLSVVTNALAGMALAGEFLGDKLAFLSSWKNIRDRRGLLIGIGLAAAVVGVFKLNDVRLTVAGRKPVAFYGRVPDAADVPNIKAKMMLHYAGLDDRINAGIPEFKAALEAAGIDYTMYTYEGVNHAFHNDTSEARYDKAAAELAWQRTIEFFEATLG